MGPGAVGYVLGICKAYTTRVGLGPFPTELHNESARRSAAAARSSASTPGASGASAGSRHAGATDCPEPAELPAGTDQARILDGFDSIEVCIGYKLDGKEIDHLPAGEGAQARLEPIYETIEGWKQPTANARSWADLPAQAIKYVRRSRTGGVPDRPVVHQPEREDTILVQNPFEA